MLNKLVPRQKVKTVYEIDLAQLKKEGYKGIITDLDNTLVGAKDPHATPELIEWLKQVHEMGFQVVIVSNNRHSRVSAFAKPLELSFINSARKPTNYAFHKALNIMKLRPEQTIVVGDQMLTDVFGGNRLGLFTILVDPISINDEGFMTKINRRIEKVALAWMKSGK